VAVKTAERVITSFGATVPTLKTALLVVNPPGSAAVIKTLVVVTLLLAATMVTVSGSHRLIAVGVTVTVI
jgi:hypothetical protein